VSNIGSKESQTKLKQKHYLAGKGTLRHLKRKKRAILFSFWGAGGGGGRPRPWPK